MTTSPDPSAQNAPPSQQGAAGRVLRTVVLLENAPQGVGEVLDLFMPGMSDQLGGLPLPQMSIAVNGVEMTFEASSEPVVARELDYAVSQSPLRDRVQAAVERHRGHVVLSAEAGDDVFRASDILSNVTATCADDPNGLAVWLPDADHVTTDVMYAGEVSQRPAQVWFYTMAARADATSSIAHTIGVHHLGGRDVQLRTSALSPGDAHRELRGAVATLLEQRTLPTAGTTVTIAGAPHVLTPGTSLLGMGDVLDAVPTGQPAAQAPQQSQPSSTPQPPQEKPKRKGWFGRRG